ncbi:Protein phosphatase 1L [Chionoecetes opilio]|uniref:Protein phosphatase 1L n=1 Tax=Chionoecetes opilio TaxID=41210 RepID=A0A8J5BW17_CHIOP|nr:Protein phosphatase 1L [Chionoecetes opilio]
MDDQLEGEVLCEVFWAHVHLLGRYVAITSAGLVDMVTPGPGETFKAKMLQPGPFLFLVFMAIVCSMALQNSGHLVWELLARTHRVLGLHRVADSTLRGLDLGSVCGTGPSGSEWCELQEGAVGVYGLQGRRATMEDRYSVIQNVDVGSKTLSFLGVFDGHGGQVSDLSCYVPRRPLLAGHAAVWQQWCSSGGCSGGSSGGSSSSETRSNIKTRGNSNGKADNKRWSGIEDSLKEIGESCPANNNNNDKATSPKTPAVKVVVEAQDVKEKVSSPTGGDTKHTAATPEATAGGSCVENLNSIITTTTTSTTTSTSTCTNSSSSSSSTPSASSPSSPSHGTKDNTVSQKRDETYSNVCLRRSSLASSTPTKDKKEEAVAPGAGTGCGGGSGNPSDSCYMDVLQNINYTRLLTDQILAVDRQVVTHCKARTDMSGSTAVVAVLDGELLVIGNVGDSRAVMGDLKGSTIPLSFDHKPNQLKERRRIKEAGGFITFTGVWRVAGVLATSRALGDFPLKEPRQLITAEPDVLTFSLTDHRAHFIILATDGLWDVMTNEEAVAFVRDHLHEADHGAKSLTMHAYYRGSQDNITVAILNVSKLQQK